MFYCICIRAYHLYTMGLTLMFKFSHEVLSVFTISSGGHNSTSINVIVPAWNVTAGRLRSSLHFSMVHVCRADGIRIWVNLKPGPPRLPRSMPLLIFKRISCTAPDVRVGGEGGETNHPSLFPIKLTSAEK